VGFLQHCRRHFMLERIVFLQTGSACSGTFILSTRSPTSFGCRTARCRLHNVALFEQTQYACESNEDTRTLSLSCNFLCTTVWANPQFCPDSWLDFYRPCVIMEFHVVAALLAISHTAHLALFLSCNNGNSNRVPLRTLLSNVPRYSVGT